MPNDYSVWMTKREKILHTTLELIANQSIQATPMSQIAKESGVATGTIYHHFASKEEIVQQIYLSTKQDFQRIIQSNLHPSQNVKSQFISLWKSIYEYYINNPLAFRFVQQVNYSPYINETTRAEAQQYYQEVYQFFEAGIKAGHFVEMEVVLIGELIHGNISTLVEMQLNNMLEQPESQIQHAIEFSWNAIKV
ncbi:TetR/AcrR family transcriptional regulator [Pontibacter cellulosilyticus]|uniref:TetR/AcrR family transcriptional regulator n=1 Tax=Pontibacter cellulosilyticus TaxID=1720253 RepID=A0A923SID7_9BACT|nr:TetR/AcrR family transcriptional regulator [Pontibacter cellulosilyticus]MBC5992497.1 TetR/AcrR family transcriptional regulator [Pontibacter cellulosilyticus]